MDGLHTGSDGESDLAHAAELAAINVQYLRDELKLRDAELLRSKKTLERVRLDNAHLKKEVEELRLAVRARMDVDRMVSYDPPCCEFR